MKGFVDDIEHLTEANTDFRRVLYTGANLQLGLMALQPGDEIGEEVHSDRDQFFRIEAGEGEIWIDGVCNKVKADDGIIVPQGARRPRRASAYLPRQPRPFSTKSASCRHWFRAGDLTFVVR